MSGGRSTDTSAIGPPDLRPARISQTAEIARLALALGRARAALEWYANLLHYQVYYSAVDGNWWSDAMEDGGERARAALKAMEATE